MADRVYPATKPPAATGNITANGGGNPSLPANKAQQYNTNRPMYRPQPPRHRRGRSCCCRCCLWTTLVVLVIILLAAIAGVVFWLLYRPQRPSFTVTSLQIPQFNLTSSSHINSRFNFTVSARNPNKKIVFFYDPVSISITSNGVDVGDGSIPGFVHGTRNTTTLRAVVSNSGESTADSTAITRLRSDLRNRRSLPLLIQLETKVRVKVGSLKSEKIRIKVSCDGIRATPPTGRSATTASTSHARCKVDVRVKIWKWSI